MTAVSLRRVPAARAAAGQGTDAAAAVQWAGRALVYAALIGGIAFYVEGNPSHAQQASTAAVYGLIALSLNVLIGYVGQLSLGQQGFVGIGALFSAYTATVQGLPFGVCVVLGAAFGAGAALLLGLVALRITGLYLALVTLVFPLTLQTSLFEVKSLTNGGAGQPAIRPGFLVDNDRFFLLCVGCLAVVFYLDRRLTSSKAGRALLALKENERVAAAYGVNVTAYKLLAFTFSGAVAGLAGSLLAFNVQQFNAESYGFPLALTFVIMTVIGGAGSRVGVVLGGVLVFSLRPLYVTYLTPHLGGLLGPFADNQNAVPDLIAALLLLLTLTTAPGGLAQQLRPLLDWLAGKPFTLHHGDGAGSGPGVVEGSSVRA